MANIRRNYVEAPRSESNRGAILLLAMVFLVLLALMSSTLMQTAVLEVRMAGNSLVRETISQTAKGVASDLSMEAANFDTALPVGLIRCLAASTQPDCDKRDLSMDKSVSSLTENTEVKGRIVRQFPIRAALLPIREAQEIVSSAVGASYALFEVDVEIKAGQAAAGSARLVHGVAIRLPESE